MLLLNIQRICAEKGVARPTVFLKGLGFSPSVITDMLAKRRTRLAYGQVEKLCLALRCTPNDLFEWQPEDGADIGHPMQALLRNKPSIPDLLHSLPAEKIEQVRALMMQLRSEEAVK